MIKEVIKFAVVCDECGRTFRDRFWGKNAFDDKVTARERANDDGWTHEGDKFFCPDCLENHERRRLRAEAEKNKSKRKERNNKQC